MIADLLPTEDQSMIQDSVASFLADRLPVERLRDTAAAGGGAERAEWAGLAEIGVFGMGLAEDKGGVGYDLAEEVIAARELGRNLVSSNVLATMLAAHLAADRPELVADLAAGVSRAAFANLGEAGETSAQLIDAEGADHFVAWDETSAFLFPAAGAANRTVKAAMDDTLQVERADLAGLTRHGVSLAQRADVLVCAYLTGIAEAAVAMAVEYAKTRQQFDQPIGAFQAIKHACADMAVRAEAARAQTFYAALAVQTADPSAATEVAAARLIARRSAIENAKANIQIHGGMGFTQESTAHLYLKRALTMATLNASLGRDLARLKP
jgi:alkylation response protein AidB-like acyl-CoA dehydrogenase